MNTSEIILRIKEYIKDAHSFSNMLGESTSILSSHLIDSLSDYYISPSEIRVALYEMKRLKEIEFGTNDVIILTKDYKHEYK